MRIAMIASESNPLCKTGGLADVVYSLSKQLREDGEDVIVVLPFYSSIRDKGVRASYVGSYPVSLSWRHQNCDVYHCREGGVEFYLLDLSVRGEYPPYVASYLKSHGLYPQTLPEDAAALKASTPDFIGINYYFSICVKAKEGPVNYDQPPFWVSDAFDICDNPHLRKTEWMDKGIDPVGLHIGMRKVYNRYRLPMIVTENGMACSETLGEDGHIHDPYRIEYLKEHIEQLAIMIDEGLPVFGYCPWSFVDVVSSHQGFAKRYGLVYVDRTETDPKQCARVKKDSFYWYQKVIARNGLPE